MKLSHESYGEKVTIEIDHDDIDMEKMYHLIQKLLLAVGYHSDTVKEYFEEQ